MQTQSNAQIMQLSDTYIANTYSRAPIAVSHGQGSLLYGCDGKEYIDLGAGIATTGFGVNDAEWVQAVTQQLQCVQHTSNLYYTAPQAQLAQLLCQKTGMKKVFFSNSGAEANECAIKTARKYAHDRYGDSRPNIVTLLDSFHGRTLATLSATGQEIFHKDFGPFPTGFCYAPANNLPALQELLAQNNVCAVMMELVQGESGVNVLDKEYVQAASQLCAQNDVLLIIDEVQTGNGRTGSLYAYMQYGITPDIVSTAKALAGGLPLGATMMGEKTADTLCPGDHGSTFGGNPVSCAGAVSVISRITPQLLAEVTQKGDMVKAMLQNAPGVTQVTGLGLMLGIQTEKPAGEVIAACREKGVLVLSAHGKVRLVPALNIPAPLLQKAVTVIMEVLAQ